MKIMVAMSGGVDSSTVACMLHDQGHEVVGVMMKLWTDPLATDVRRTLPKKCCSIEHIERARAVCKQLDVPFYVVNLEDEFKSKVVDYFLEGYKDGDTPNPCIECNRVIKFGLLLEKSIELGCDMIATGHYAKIVDNNSYLALHKAKDESRDQSYYLYTLSQEKLKRIMFPLQDFYKSDVFELAKHYNVPLQKAYAESEDLCFYPEKEPKEFLKRYIKDMKPGDIIDNTGSVVGKHKGLPFYTIGQRKGLGIGGLKIPLHVTRKEKDTNTIYVSPSGADLESEVHAKDAHWIHNKPSNTDKLTMRIHSLGQQLTGELIVHSNDNFDFVTSAPIRGIAAGQSAVLYDGTEVIGGGKIY